MRLFLIFLLCTNILLGVDFESSNYYMNNYLFDAQVYAKDTFVTENYISHSINDFQPYIAFLQYQSLDNYQESDIGIGTEYKFLDKYTLDVGSWYYFYYDNGGHYFEPYVSLSYDWYVVPKIYVSVLSYNQEYRSTFSLEKEIKATERLKITPKVVIGTVNYDGFRYGYFGFVNRIGFNLTDKTSLFLTTEIDQPYDSIDNESVHSIIFGFVYEM